LPIALFCKLHFPLRGFAQKSAYQSVYRFGLVLIGIVSRVIEDMQIDICVFLCPGSGAFSDVAQLVVGAAQQHDRRPKAVRRILVKAGGDHFHHHSDEGPLTQFSEASADILPGAFRIRACRCVPARCSYVPGIS